MLDFHQYWLCLIEGPILYKSVTSLELLDGFVNHLSLLSHHPNEGVLVIASLTLSNVFALSVPGVIPAAESSPSFEALAIDLVPISPEGEARVVPCVALA